jgi:hypothetical protein
MLVLKFFRDGSFLRDVGLKWDSVSIGCSEKSLVTLPGVGVAEEHLVVRREGDQFILRLASEGATAVCNGQELLSKDRRVLSGGDVFEFAGYRVDVLDASSGMARDSGEYFTRARVFKELQITEGTLNNLVEAGDIPVHHFHGSEVFDKDAVLSLRDRMQVRTTRRMEALVVGEGGPAYFTFEEVGSILGADDETLHGLVARGDLRAFRLDDLIRFRSEDVSALLRQGPDALFVDGSRVIIDSISAESVHGEESDVDVEEDETEETADGPPATPAPPVKAVKAPGPAPPKSAIVSIHYFRRMTPMRTFPFYIQGKMPVPLRVRAVLPGCLSVPAEVELTKERNKAEIWVTPLSAGPLPVAEFEVFVGRKKVGEIATPVRCTPMTLPLALIILAPAWLLLGLLVDALPPPAEGRHPLLPAMLSQTNGPLTAGLGLFLVTLALGLLFYFLARPAEGAVLSKKFPVS